jgi:hypothetical protein
VIHVERDHALMKTLPQIKAEVDRRATLIGAIGDDLPTYGCTQDGAYPHVEVDSRGYHVVVVERGQESRFTTRDFDELLYKIFQSVTFRLAYSYALAHRIESQDWRRLLFQRQVELLSRLSPHWGERKADEHQRILREHPFDDLSSMRASLSAQVGWKRACEQYPLPSASAEFGSLGPQK